MKAQIFPPQWDIGVDMSEVAWADVGKVVKRVNAALHEEFPDGVTTTGKLVFAGTQEYVVFKVKTKNPNKAVDIIKKIQAYTARELE